jgi:hypothetical protein
MTVDHQIIFEDSNPLEGVVKSFVSFFNWLFVFINKLSGLLGLVVLAPLLAVVGFFLWLILKLSNRKLTQLLHNAFSKLDTSDVRSIMIFHSIIKNKRIDVETALNGMDLKKAPLIVKPITVQISYTLKLYSEAEDRLHKTACPHLYVPFTREQLEQLKDFEKDFEGVWESNDYVIV